MENFDYKEDEMVHLYSDDTYKDYVRSILRYPVLSREEINRLFDLYREGDMGAREKIINSNLRLVIFVARRFAKRLTHMEFLDVVQEGNLGLIRALDTYDYNQGAFTTYAYEWIRQAVIRGLANYDDEIRKPVHIKSLIVKYYQVVDKYESQGLSVSDEQLCEELEINPERLETLRKIINTTPISINSKVIKNAEEEGDEIGDFVADEETNVEDIIRHIDSTFMISAIRMVLDDNSYFVLYCRYIANPSYSLEVVAKEMGITRERVRQIENKAARKVKSLFNSRRDMYSKRKELIQRKCKIRVQPVTPDQIILYNFLKNRLSKIEQMVLYNFLFSHYELSYRDIGLNVGISEVRCKEILDNLVQIINEVRGSQNFVIFKKHMLEKYKGSIYKNDFVHDIEYIDYDSLRKKYKEIPYENLLELLEDNKFIVPDSTKELLRYIYDNDEDIEIDKNSLERKLNIILLNYGLGNNTVEKKKLRVTYDKYIECFRDEERLYLECFFFNTRNRKEFTSGYNDERFNNILRKLEKYFYHVYDYVTVTKNTYLTIKDLFKERFSEKEISLLDKYYSNSLNFEKINVDLFNRLICKLNRIYVEEQDLISIRREVYRNNAFNYGKESIVYKYFVENISIEQLIIIFNKSREEIVNEIRNEVFNIDKKRFNVFNGLRVDEMKMYHVFRVNELLFNTLDRDIIISLYIKNMEKEKICELYNVRMETIDYAINLFERTYIASCVGKMGISMSDFIGEACTPSPDSVLDENERMVLKAFVSTPSKNEVMRQLNMEAYKFEEVLNRIKNKIWAKKLDLYKTYTSNMPKLDVIRCMNDFRTPLLDSEKELLRHLYELEGYSYMSLEDMAKEKGMSIKAMEDEFFKIVIKLKKYKVGAIKGKYKEEDYIPYKKYFSDFEMKIIKGYYNNRIKDICNKYHMCEEEVIDLIKNCEFKLDKYMMGENDKQISYTAFNDIKAIDDLPFDGDLDDVLDLVDLYYGLNSKDRKSIREIEMYNDNVYKTITDLLLSIYKYKDGYRKTKKISFKDVVKCYEVRHKMMSPELRNMFLEYINGSREINDDIIFEVIKSKDTIIPIDQLEKRNIKKILREKDQYLSDNEKKQLMALYKIDYLDLANDDKVYDMYLLLSRLDRKLEQNNSMIFS